MWDRRKELDAYEAIVIGFASRIEGTTFYEHHKAFSALAAALIQQNNVKLDWGSGTILPPMCREDPELVLGRGKLATISTQTVVARGRTAHFFTHVLCAEHHTLASCAQLNPMELEHPTQ